MSVCVGSLRLFDTCSCMTVRVHKSELCLITIHVALILEALLSARQASLVGMNVVIQMILGLCAICERLP